MDKFAERRHGNNLHGQVVKFLRDSDWHVMVSPFYTDAFTDKPREADVIAEKDYWDPEHVAKGVVGVKLFIECKFMDSEKKVVFWTDKKDLERAKEIITVRDVTASHYYYIKEAAKLFATADARQEIDPFFNALNQVLNATIYYRKRVVSIIPQGMWRTRLTHLIYPIIVVNNFDSLFAKTLTGEDEPRRIAESYFQLEVNYAYPNQDGGGTEYFLVDVVNFKKFDDYLGELERKDIMEAKRDIRQSK